jgi:hypothetical protein
MPPTPHPAPASTADEPTAASTARIPRPLLRDGIFAPRPLVRFAVAAGSRCAGG